MLHHRITNMGDGAALLLSPELLQALEVKIGDEVDIAVIDRTLIVRALDEAERGQRIGDLIQVLLKRRQSAYERLAQGA
jgi:antitoxin component of MazEF toxin-antitoxin module